MSKKSKIVGELSKKQCDANRSTHRIIASVSPLYDEVCYNCGAWSNRNEDGLSTSPCPETVKANLEKIIVAWEKLEVGQQQPVATIERWLIRDMAPAINKARRILGRSKPSARQRS